MRSSTVRYAEEANANSANANSGWHRPGVSGTGRSIRSRLLSLYRRSPGIIAAGFVAVLFATAYLLAAPMGRDLSAQLAHAQLAESHWPELLDLRWYGGFNPLGYSVLSPPVMALWAYA